MHIVEIARGCAGAALVSLFTLSCGPSVPAPSGAPSPPPLPVGPQTKCGVTKSQEKPLIVEWPSAARGDLETQARGGLVVVRYRGCEMDVLPRCRAPGAYVYAPFTPKVDRVIIRDQDELWASIPIGAARFEGTLRQAGQLNVAMTLVGKMTSDRGVLRAAELSGDCEGATHVIVGITVGAFEFFAGADQGAGAGAQLFGAGGGAKTAALRETLTKDGLTASCAAAKLTDPTPPEGCGALLRLEVLPLGATEVPRAAVCPEGSEWDGLQCVRTSVVTKIQCPEGTALSGTKCMPLVVTDCPAGMEFVKGKGCAAKIAESPPPASSDMPDIGEQTAAALVRQFYASRGEFKGQYLIDRILKMRVVRTGEDTRQVHVHYAFRCTRGPGACCCGDDGEDQRVFALRFADGSWDVAGMGAHMSARF